MPAPLRVRELTDEERFAIERLARSRKAATRLTARARIVWYSSRGEVAETIAERIGTCAHTVRRWITRVTTSGWAGLDDAARSGDRRRPRPRRWPRSWPSCSLIRRRLICRSRAGPWTGWRHTSMTGRASPSSARA